MSLVELRATGLAVVDGIRLVPGRGMTAITGETGAGKSLCIAALRLAVGGRAESDVIAPGDDVASVAAVFDEIPPAVHQALAAHGIAADEVLTLTRELRATGKGACRVNGSLVSQTTLAGIGHSLVEVTSQGESHRLLRPAYQRALLDSFAGEPVEEARVATTAAHQRWREAADALTAARAAAERDAGAVERSREVVADLDGLGLCPGEDRILSAERERLRRTAELTAAAAGVHQACSGQEEEGAGAADLLAAAIAAGQSVAGVDSDLAGLLVEAGELGERLRELGARARALRDGFAVDGDRLAAVEARLDALDRVRRRHGSIEKALEVLDEARQTVDTAADPDSEQRRLASELAQCEARLCGLAETLSRTRRSAAASLERAISTQLRRLRVPHARFRVVLSQQPDPAGIEVDGTRVACGPDGVDTVEFRLATAEGGLPLPLGGYASGGELSRVALALRAVAAVCDDCPTVVLDEVDIGLGGETAARVGEVLAAIAGRARQRQVLVITHRSEIAARATDHLLVSKRDLGGEVRVDVGSVAGKERVMEMARLMSGRATEAAMARARELLVEGGAAPPRSGVSSDRSRRVAARTIAAE